MIRATRVGTAVLLLSWVSVGCSRGGDATTTTATPVDVLRGKASYYHDSLAGNHTANGERYRPKELTAAHRSLPFCTIVRVVRVDTGESVQVRINDRGPFGSKTRILDLSRAAAQKIHMIQAGVVEVRAEVLEVGDGCRHH
ncbi:MAG: septal ring lytic transglycosylase RlpA family protein [Polyangiales bacterium]